MKKLIIFIIATWIVVLMLFIFRMILYLATHYGREIAHVLIVLLIVLLIFNIYRIINKYY